MRVVVAGFGVQGKKRKLVAGSDCVAVVDPVHPDVDFRALQDVPLDQYDAVLACIPDAPKCEILNYCVANGKHVLVEKPLWFEREDDRRIGPKSARQRRDRLYGVQSSLRAALCRDA